MTSCQVNSPVLTWRSSKYPTIPHQTDTNTCMSMNKVEQKGTHAYTNVEVLWLNIFKTSQHVQADTWQPTLSLLERSQWVWPIPSLYQYHQFFKFIQQRSLLVRDQRWKLNTINISTALEQNNKRIEHMTNPASTNTTTNSLQSNQKRFLS